MEIRQLRAEEFDERMELSQFAFQYAISEQDLEARRRRWRPEHDWGAFDEEGRLLSAAVVIPLEAWVQGKKLAMGGVAGVATWPDARRQGCVSKLLSHALVTMKKDGQSISMLHPFAFPFYRKFGWEMTVERKKYTLATGQLPKRLEAPGQVKRIAKPDIAVLDRVYEAYASRYSGTLLRTAEWWEERILTKKGSWALYENDDGEPEGYVFYEVADRKLTVHDWAITTEASRVSLWTYVGNHDSMIDEVALMAPIDDPLPFLLADPRIKQEVIPYFMSRIVDAEAFIGQYSWAAGARDESVMLVLSDAHAPWNDGVFRLVWGADGEGKLERATEEAGSADRAILCDIQALTAMLAGNRKPGLLREVGRISGPEESVALLERRIPERTTHLMDFF